MPLSELLGPMTTLAALTGLALLAQSRMSAAVRTAALQGAAVSLMPLVLAKAVAPHVLVVSLLSLTVKAVIFPVLIGRTLGKVKGRLEIEPYLGYPASVLLGIVGLIAAFWLSGGLESRVGPVLRYPLGTGFFMLWSGLLLIITRKKAITQVIGYLAAENGIFVLGSVLGQADQMVIELCILLDVLVAIFVMGIAIHHINRQFDSIDTDRFCSIRD